MTGFTTLGFRQFLLPPLLILLFGACASKPPEPDIYSIDGYSLALPKDSGWRPLQETPARIVLGKPGRFAGETMTIQLATLELPPQAAADGLIRHVRDSERRDLNAKKFRIVKHEVGPHATLGQACARSHLEADDRSAAGTTGPAVNVVVELMTVTCPHPTRPGGGMSLSYMHRFFPEDRDTRFTETAQAVLDLIRYTPDR